MQSEDQRRKQGISGRLVILVGAMTFLVGLCNPAVAQPPGGSATGVTKPLDASDDTLFEIIFSGGP
ncbi:MAG: hypothetical protein ACKOAU_18320, partial [Pirellula sp.]